jgi:hypothetical protein
VYELILLDCPTNAATVIAGAAIGAQPNQISRTRNRIDQRPATSADKITFALDRQSWTADLGSDVQQAG